MQIDQSTLFGKGIYLVFIFVFSFCFGFFYRSLLKQFKSKNIQKRANSNIGKIDRQMRLGLAILLLVYGLYSWSFVILFFSGFCFFEAIFSWCGFNALIGKNSCDL